MNILKTTSNLSQGNVTCLIFNFFEYVEDEHLVYAAKRNRNLKRLALPIWSRLPVSGMRKAFKYWKGLESLTVPDFKSPMKLMKAIGTNCKNFSELKLTCNFNLDYANAIVKYVPKLKSHSSDFLVPMDISGVLLLPSPSSSRHCQKRVTAVMPTVPVTLGSHCSAHPTVKTKAQSDRTDNPEQNPTKNGQKTPHTRLHAPPEVSASRACVPPTVCPSDPSVPTGPSLTSSLITVDIEVVVQQVLSHTSTALSVTSGKQPWFFDTACCNHMTPDESKFSDKAPLEHPITIYIVDGTPMPVSHKGTISSSCLSLSDTFHIPKLSLNLFSVSQLCELGVDLLFTNHGVDVQDP
uniref:Retrovirus-related Pol polyprotein from transposon TNT 1-94-like beta-barrel domain-containing protein n=1 Tax=Quercus lobata TaxID=97700 RepID=A0A7N2R8Y2_QUELO